MIAQKLLVMQKVCILAALVSLLSGCQQSDYPLVAVSGVVTFDGGECPASGNVTFQPLKIADGLPKRPATGRFGVDGNFEVNTFSESVGVLPGLYRVEVTCFAGAPDPSKPDPWGEVDFIADSYQPTELTVEADGGPIVHNIDVPKREKASR